MIYREHITVTLDLWEFFSKWGFGEGDEGAATDVAWGLRDSVIEVLNKHLPKGTHAEAEEVSSIHNECLISIAQDGVSIYPRDGTCSDEELALEKTWPVGGIGQAMQKALAELRAEYVEEEMVSLPVKHVREVCNAVLYALDPERGLLERGWCGKADCEDAIGLLVSLLESLLEPGRDSSRPKSSSPHGEKRWNSGASGCK